MRCRTRDYSVPERKPGTGLTRVSAVLALGFWSALDAVLAVMATPLVRAKWRHLLQDRALRRPTPTPTGGGEGPRPDVSARVEVVHRGNEDPDLLNLPALLLSDHRIDDRSAHGAA